VALGLHLLGRPVTLSSCWGDDPPGALIGAHLAATGVPVRRLRGLSRRSTVALAYVDTATGSADYDFLTAWDPAHIPLDPGVTLLHTGSLAAVVDPGTAQVLDACRQLHGRPGCAVALDLNVRPAVQPDRNAYRTAITRRSRPPM
jgi:fructokinase